MKKVYNLKTIYGIATSNPDKWLMPSPMPRFYYNPIIGWFVRRFGAIFGYEDRS